MVMNSMKKFIDFIQNNKIFRFIYGTIKTLICLILAVYIIFVLYQRFTGNASLFGYRVFTVASGSMSPEYVINDVIYIKEVDPGTLKVGDDIAYKGERGGFEGLTITHRIVEIEETSDGGFRIVTQGVNNELEDPSIDEYQILGKVYGKVFFINELNHVVKSLWGFFFLIFLPLSLIIILEILETIYEGRIERGDLVKIEKNKNWGEEVEQDIVEVTSLKEVETPKLNKQDEIPSVEEEKEDEEEII